MTKPIRPIRIEGNLAYVPLTQGYEAVIDAADVPLVDGLNWCARIEARKCGSIRSVYAVTTININSDRRKISMHRILLKAESALFVDHIDGNGLNNCKKNLRFASNSQNQMNRKANISSKTGIKGVIWHKASQKWYAKIEVNGKRTFLGTFLDVDDAIAAYAKASHVMHGEYRNHMTPTHQPAPNVTDALAGCGHAN